MGKKDKNKKKGKGAEKTVAKTEKKVSNKLKKELEALGEDDIESIVAQIEKEEQQRVKVTESVTEPPSRRLNFTFISHPLKDELILYGGEFDNGQKTFLYNDLFFYNITTNTWTVVKAPAGPPPRCGHQMVATSSNKGQLWVFGGEFSSPTQSQFYHYRDLWVYHLASKQWEKINAPNGPSARSGHRMICHKKQLFVFGGFYDNLRDYKYYNDLYIFDMETYKWHKIEATGSLPSPRSGCCLTPLPDGKILLYGGYSKEKLKKDVDKGHTYTDSFCLTPDKNDTSGLKWKWSQIKIGGLHISPRCSMPMTTAPNNVALCFGGVFDVEDDEETLAGKFFNDAYSLDLEKLVWRSVLPSGKKEKDNKARRRKHKEEGNDIKDDVEDPIEIEQSLEQTTIADDGIFKVSIGPTPTNPAVGSSQGDSSSSSNIFIPSPRMNCGLAVKHGTLYLYGGMFEDGDKQITLNDFYSFDMKKMDEWKTIIADDQIQEWLGSDSGSEGEDSESSEGEESGDEAMDTD
ncbi:kelch domain-containing protein [Holotrichia oblita]|uniref:Kelch domain-containing protein n=1 Tax=Holotrichia oblita TaxID=644536 RepID=A0ACB9TSN5_HOLOL|nr:kelch domain-containing protein [Holotrichia oblita]